MTMAILRFNCIQPGLEPKEMSARYRAFVEMAAIGDEQGFGVVNLEEHHGAGNGWSPSPMLMAGMVVARQRPATANGIVFMLLEDDLGQFNLILPSKVYEQHRAIVRGEPLLLAHGRFEHVGKNRNILVDRLQSLSELARQVAGEREIVSALPGAHHFGHR